MNKKYEADIAKIVLEDVAQPLAEMVGVIFLSVTPNGYVLVKGDPDKVNKFYDMWRETYANRMVSSRR